MLPPKNSRIYFIYIPLILFLFTSCSDENKNKYNIETLTKPEIILLDKKLKQEDSSEIINIFNKINSPDQKKKNALYYLIKFKLSNIIKNDSANYFIKKIQEFQEKKPNALLNALFLQNKGYQLEKMGKTDSAGYYYFISLNIKKKEKLDYLLSSSYYYYSYHLFSQGLYEDAITNAHKAINFFEKKDSVPPSYYNLIANSYYNLEQDENAQRYYTMGINSALANKDSISYIGIKGNLVNLFTLNNDFDSALIYLNEAKLFNEKRNKFYEVSALLTNIGNIYLSKNNLDSAIIFINQSNEIATKNKYFDLGSSNYEILSNIYSKKQDYPASLKNLQLKQEYEDSLLVNKNKNFVQELETKYKNDEQSGLIKYQNVELEKRNLQIIISIIIAVFLLILSGLVFIFYQRKIKEEKAIHSMEINKMLKESEDKIFSSLFKGRETERLKLSEELHDGIGSQLALCKMQLSTFSMENIDDNKIANISKLVDKVSKDIRSLSHAMNTGATYGFDISAALTELSEEISKTALIKVNFFQTGDKIILDENRNINIYRIVQEIINNTLKHAQAKVINIHLHKDDEKITLLIEDDGIGFNQKAKADGIGLKNMKSRIKEIHGELTIDSTIGIGTTTIIEIPNNIIKNK